MVFTNLHIRPTAWRKNELGNLSSKFGTFLKREFRDLEDHDSPYFVRWCSCRLGESNRIWGKSKNATWFDYCRPGCHGNQQESGDLKDRTFNRIESKQSFHWIATMSRRLTFKGDDIY